MKLLGVLSIVQGVLMVVSIWGILLCWLPIWIGVVLHRAAGRLEMAYLNGDRAMLREGTEQLRKFFTINGVLALVYVIVMGVVLLFVILAGGLGALSSLREA
jgi:cell division protein FtsX